MDTNDGSWKYTALLLCNVVETDVAIIVSCTPGFAKFTRAYLPRLGLFKSPRSSINDSGIKFNDDLNRPRAEKWLKNRETLRLTYSTIAICSKAQC